MVRTNAEKSSKKWFFIQNLPPLQNGKCYQSAPTNCDYMVNLIPSPYIPIGKLGYKVIPTKPIGIQGIMVTAGKALFLQLLARVYYDFFLFWYKSLTFHPTTHPCVSSSPSYIVPISTSHHPSNHLSPSFLFITLPSSLYSSYCIYIHSLPSSLHRVLVLYMFIIYSYGIHLFNVY